MVRGRVGIALFLLGIFILSVQSPIALHQKVENPTQGRAQTVWSGTVVLNNHHTIPITDELVISPCTNITMANGIRIYVEGRLQSSEYVGQDGNQRKIQNYMQKHFFHTFGINNCINN